MPSQLKDYLFLHFLIIILGFTAILGKLITINPVALVVFRTFIASVFIGLFLIQKRESVKVSKPLLMQLLFVGFILAIHWVCFFGSARLATVSISLVAYSTTSFFTSFIEPLTTKKKISGKEVFLGLIAVLGILIIFSFESQHFIGFVIGLIGALLAAIYSTSNAILAHKLPSSVINLYQLGAACLSMLLFSPLFIYFGYISIQDSIPTSLDWLWIIILSTLCTVFPYIAMVNLMKKFNAFTITLSVNMEPIYGVALAIIFFGDTEEMSNGFYVGAVLILSTLVLHAYWNRRRKAVQV